MFGRFITTILVMVTLLLVIVGNTSVGDVASLAAQTQQAIFAVL
jgi:hypothetical protein